MKVLAKILGAIVALIIIAVITLRLFVHESEPVAKPTSEADLLAKKMTEAVNKTAWDTTKLVKWEFPGGHKFLWDKTRHFTQVEWDDTKVLLDINNIAGKVYKNGKTLTGEDAQKTIKKAWDFFNNDSFWLNAPVKAFDPGTVRSIVTLDDGRKGLKVQYMSGGTTPGDAYVWILDDSNMPIAYKMWVQIIPVGGLEFGWSDYTTLYSGAKVATMHKSKAADLEIKGVEAAETFAELGIEGDPFANI